MTSRRHLTGLVTRHGAHHVQLETLSDADAHRLLVNWLGSERIAAEPAVVNEILSTCGGFALALDIIAARAHMNPHTPLVELAADLRDETTRLWALDSDDSTSSLPAVLSWSLRSLTTDQLLVFELLGIAPGPDISLPAIASMSTLSTGAVRTVLRDLVNTSLLQEHVPGRYRMHDLVRLYAADAAERDVTDDVRGVALRRVLDFYAHTAQAANCLLEPHSPPIPHDPPFPGVHPWPLADIPAAMEWLETEHAVLLAAQQIAINCGWYPNAWQLAWGLYSFHYRRGHRAERVSVWRTALDAALRVSDAIPQMVAYRLLGHAYAYVGRYKEAVDHLQRAITMAEDHHDTDKQARAHRILAWAWERQGDDRQALKHAARARDLHRAIHQSVWEANALSAMGRYAARLGDYDTARTSCYEALSLVEASEPIGGPDILHILGYIAYQTGNYRESVRDYQQAVALRRIGDNPAEAAETLDSLGHPYVALGEHGQARLVWQEALELYREQGRDEDATRVQRQLDDLTSVATNVTWAEVIGKPHKGSPL